MRLSSLRLLQTPALPRCTLMEPGVNDRFMLCRRSNPSDRGGFRFAAVGRIEIHTRPKGRRVTGAAAS